MCRSWLRLQCKKDTKFKKIIYIPPTVPLWGHYGPTYYIRNGKKNVESLFKCERIVYCYVHICFAMEFPTAAVIRFAGIYRYGKAITLEMITEKLKIAIHKCSQWIFPSATHKFDVTYAKSCILYNIYIFFSLVMVISCHLMWVDFDYQHTCCFLKPQIIVSILCCVWMRIFLPKSLWIFKIKRKKFGTFVGRLSIDYFEWAWMESMRRNVFMIVIYFILFFGFI